MIFRNSTLKYKKKAYKKHLVMLFIDIPLDDAEVVLHCRISILYLDGETRIMKSSANAIDVPQGFSDGVEISEIMAQFIMSKINKIIHIDKYGHYREDGLFVVPSNRKLNDKIRNSFFNLFHILNLDIAVEMNIKQYNI